MKRNFILLLAFAFGIALFAGCSEDDLRDTSSIRDKTTEKTDLDRWIDANYIAPYNIDFCYRMKDVWTNLDYNLSPASYLNSIRMAKLTLHLCLNAYDEVTGSRDFMRTCFPKILHLIGSAAVNTNNTIVLGTAEGGKMMTLYMINDLPTMMPTSEDPDVKLNMPKLNEYFFKTMHHEFAHILHQTTPYTTNFKAISGSDYIGDNWSSVYKSDKDALKKGFVSAYSSKAVDEDFVELYSVYITSTASTWNGYLTDAGEEGATKIKQKMDIVADYMLKTWNIDVDKLRVVVLRRQSEIATLDLDNL